MLSWAPKPPRLSAERLLCDIPQAWHPVHRHPAEPAPQPGTQLGPCLAAQHRWPPAQGCFPSAPTNHPPSVDPSKLEDTLLASYCHRLTEENDVDLFSHIRWPEVQRHILGLAVPCISARSCQQPMVSLVYGYITAVSNSTSTTPSPTLLSKDLPLDLGSS